MRRSSFIALLVMIGFAGGIWIYSHRTAANERAVVTSQQARARSLRTQLAKLQRERDDAEHAAAELARGLQQEAAATAAVGATDKVQTQPWLERVKRLRGLFAQRPDQSSPELTLLTELDWIELAQTIPAGDDDRQARFRVRDFANERFFALLRVAVRDRVIHAGGAPLTDPMQLQPFFQPAIDPAILARYEIAASSIGLASQPRLSLAARAPVDLEYDVCRSFFISDQGQANVGSLMSAPWVTYLLMKVRTDAMVAYRAANGSLSNKASDLLTYATDPTGRALFEASVAYQKAHDGKSFSAFSDLLPYATDPEVRPLFESLARAEQRQRVLNERKKDQ